MTSSGRSERSGVPIDTLMPQAAVGTFDKPPPEPVHHTPPTPLANSRTHSGPRRLPRPVTAFLLALTTLAGFANLRCGPGAGANTTAPLAIPDSGGPAFADSSLARLILPEGFRVSVYAHVPNARMLVRSDDGTVFVSSRRGGRVHAVRDLDGDGYAETVDTLAVGLNMPNGIALRDGALFVAEVNQIWRFDDIAARLTERGGGPDSTLPAPVLVSDAFPEDSPHGCKFIAFGPDDKLYVPVGAPCNICDAGDPYASILRMNPDGTELETFARGVRNTVGFTWHPETGEMWFTDNGRDLMGDDIPPCELNHAPSSGMHFGYPHFHGGTIPDPEFGAGHEASDFVAPAHNLGAHVAPLGLEFYTGDNFPDQYDNQLLVAEHGSWNRSRKVGYRVMRASVVGDSVTAYEPFVQGWLQDEETWGRPVDVEQLADGTLLVSDDWGGRIYRVWYEAPN